MTEEEAKLVGEIAMTADSGCGPCGEALMERLAEAFPERRESFASVLRGMEYDDSNIAEVLARSPYRPA